MSTRHSWQYKQYFFYLEKKKEMERSRGTAMEGKTVNGAHAQHRTQSCTHNSLQPSISLLEGHRRNCRCLQNPSFFP